MKLNRKEIGDGYFYLSALRRQLDRERRAIPDGLAVLIDHFEAEVKAMSRPGHQTRCRQQRLDKDQWIGPRTAAGILEVTQRQVNRLATDLEGVLVEGRYIFPRSVVEDYAERRRDARPTSSGGAAPR